MAVAPEILHGRLHGRQGAVGEGVGELVALGLLGQLLGVVLGEQGLAVGPRGVEGLSAEGRGGLSLDGGVQQRRAEPLAGPVISSDELGGLFLQIHGRGVVHNLSGDGELILPCHVLQGLGEALLEVVNGVSAVLAHRNKAIHGGHGGELLAPVGGLLHGEDFLHNGLLLKGLPRFSRNIRIGAWDLP